MHPSAQLALQEPSVANWAPLLPLCVNVALPELGVHNEPQILLQYVMHALPAHGAIVKEWEHWVDVICALRAHSPRRLVPQASQLVTNVSVEHGAQTLARLQELIACSAPLARTTITWALLGRMLARSVLRAHGVRRVGLSLWTSVSLVQLALISLLSAKQTDPYASDVSLENTAQWLGSQLACVVLPALGLRVSSRLHATSALWDSGPSQKGQCMALTAHHATEADFALVGRRHESRLKS